ncbi:MAG: AAA family ATPase, partial [Prevotella sp.]|nr:AAA family ATPase [Prevotella sp.]
MNIVHSGSRYMVYGEDIRTYHDLPVGSYDVDFSKMTGFFLSDRSDLVASEEKVYGSTPAKVAKVMSAYQATDRNFGVLLSGQKGIGKSLFVRVLAEKAVEAGFPVLVVGRAIPGIAGFLSSIDQDCVVVFDEFEKTFAKNDDYNPQDEMLSLFDGIDGGHKMFVVTCNDVGKLSEYMLNHPGRFHYHFIMKPPTSDEITEYLIDNIKPEYATLIPKIASLVGAIDLP